MNSAMRMHATHAFVSEQKNDDEGRWQNGFLLTTTVSVGSLPNSKGFQLTNFTKTVSFPSYSSFFLLHRQTIGHFAPTCSCGCGYGLEWLMQCANMIRGVVIQNLDVYVCIERALDFFIAIYGASWASPHSMTNFLHVHVHVDGASRGFRFGIIMFVHVHGPYCCQLYSSSSVDVVSFPATFEGTLLYSFLCEVQGLKFRPLTS